MITCIICLYNARKYKTYNCIVNKCKAGTMHNKCYNKYMKNVNLRDKCPICRKIQGRFPSNYSNDINYPEIELSNSLFWDRSMISNSTRTKIRIIQLISIIITIIIVINILVTF